MYKMSIELDKILKWCDFWGFKVSKTKTVAILFGRNIMSTELEDLKLNMGDTDIDLADFTNILGIYFDRHMITWSEHIDYIIERCDKRLNLIK